MADAPSSERLSERLRKIKPKRFQAKVYRILARHYQRQPLSLQGSLGLGGRYNPPYQFGALYCGLNEAVCWAEIEKKHEGPIRRERFKLIPLHVRLTKVLDLTDLELLGRLQVAPEALTDPTDHSFTRRIAHETREAGFEGILASSSAGPGTILAIFMDRMEAASKVKIATVRRALRRR